MSSPLYSTSNLETAAKSALRPEFTAVLRAESREDFTREVVSFGKRLGFDTASATVVLDRPGGAPRFISVDNTPPAYKGFFDNPANFPGCPVMRHCKVRGTPIVWDQTTYVEVGEGARWEHQARHGYRVGIGLALHLPNGRHFFVGVDRDRPLPSDANETSRLVGALSLFALHASESATRVLAPISTVARSPLSPRELEVLRWTLEGKTAWEVGMILSISDRTAAIHANNATRKLGCINKHQAALRALQAGLL